jgi:hypothetical protein
MTTTAAPRTSPSTVARRARVATAGAVLWLLGPVVWYVSDLEVQEFGSLAFVSVAVAWWICMVAAPFLLVAGHLALRTSLGARAGRLGAIGIPTAAVGLAAMGLGIGIEVASMSVGGGEVALGHYLMLIGFLIAIVGALLTGITVLRGRRDGASRVAGWILVLALPLGLGIGFLGDLIVPQNDGSFWAALVVPTGVAWLLLGRSLATGSRTSA